MEADHHEVIQLAAILTTPDGVTELASYEAKVMPRYPERADPKALAVNGYNEEEWKKEAVPHEEASGKLLEMSPDRVFVGHNVSFDDGFLKAFVKSCGKKFNWHYHKVDTMVLLWPLFVAKKIDYFSLDSLCDYFKIPRPPTHRAMADARAARAGYLELMKLYASI